MVLVGWDDQQSAWIVKNSWVEGHANGGYEPITYSSKIGNGVPYRCICSQGSGGGVMTSKRIVVLVLLVGAFILSSGSRCSPESRRHLLHQSQ